MSPRPRKASDDEIYAAAQRVMMRRAPGQFTLAEIAREAGLTAGALVQRFGSKRDLLVAMMAQWAGSADAMFAGLRAAHPSPLAALRAYADCLAEMGASPAMFAHHLAWLQLDLTDPDLHRHLKRQYRDARSGIRHLLDDAVAAGELAPSTDTAALARAVEVTINGSLMTWAVYQDGTATAWMREDLDALFGRYADS